MASCKERANAPGTGFCGALPRNGFCALLPVIAGGSGVVPITGGENVDRTAPLSTLSVWASTGVENSSTLERASITARQCAPFCRHAVVAAHHGASITLPFRSVLTLVVPLP